MSDDRTEELERRLAAAELALRQVRDREHLLQAVFDHTYQFIGVLSREGHVLEANRSALALIEVEPAAVVGRVFAETPWWTHSPALQQRLRDAIAAAAAGEFVRFEATHVAATGALHVIDFSVKPIVGDGGEVSHLVCEGRDVTERRRVDEALRASREMFGLVLDGIPIRVFWKDLDGRYLGCNARFASDAGVASVGDVIGKTDFDFGWRSQAELYRAADARVTASGTAVFNFEEPQTSPSGDELWLRTSKIPLRDHTGAVVGVLGLYEDITARKLEEAELRARNLEMEQFVYTVSHDLKSPLVTIRGFAGMVRDDLQHGSHDHVDRDLQRIDDAAARMMALLDDLLELSRVGRIGAPLTRVALDDIVSETIDAMRGGLDARGVALTVIPTRSMIECDRGRIGQVMQNLIENAIKYMGDQTIPAITIEGRIDPAARAITVMVRDNGIGIDAAHHTRIFGLFDKLDARSPGSGVGLALVRRIVEFHGGRVWVESAGAGTGSTFLVTLPLAAAPIS